ncbi:MAG: hypothetical protein QOE80_2907, partial [Actinomycetota bacterium]|nr:hypothetical protein [Actinomycetota bacterium]
MPRAAGALAVRSGGTGLYGSAVEPDPPEAPVIDLTDIASSSRAGRELVPVPRPPNPGVDLEGKLSDVDGWGRSEHMRRLVRTVFDPIYSHWFRAEWEGLDRMPASGGALLVANHAGAIPSDAPVIMHGIEKELGRPVYGLADSFFRTLPLAGTLWSRGGGVT